MEPGLDLLDQLRILASKVKKECKSDMTEEATKHAFVLLFIRALGYDVFNPDEVVPEFIADFGQAKGEKIDYAIFKDSRPIMLFECKACGVKLEKKQLEQLSRYFHMTKARLGILTNGVEYRLYSDLDQPNILDDDPFYVFRVDMVDENVGRELKRLTKGAFNIDELLSAARELKATRVVKDYLLKQLGSPETDFVRLIATQVHSGLKTQQVIAFYTGIVKNAFNMIVSDRVQDRLQSAITLEKAVATPLPEIVTSSDVSVEDRSSGVVTTQEELEALYIVKSILRGAVDPTRIVIRDAKSYCSLFLDDNNRKPICRFRFSETSKFVELINTDKSGTKIQIELLDDIYKHADHLRGTIALYEKPVATTK